jgi:hypothetical protein
MEWRAAHVFCYSGYLADEEPRAVLAEGRRLEVAAVERRWREPDARYFTVQMADGTRRVLRNATTTGLWTMKS